MSLCTFLLSSRHHFQCAGHVQGVRDDSSLNPEMIFPPRAPNSSFMPRLPLWTTLLGHL